MGIALIGTMVAATTWAKTVEDMTYVCIPHFDEQLASSSTHKYKRTREDRWTIDEFTLIGEGKTIQFFAASTVDSQTISLLPKLIPSALVSAYSSPHQLQLTYRKSVDKSCQYIDGTLSFL